MSWARFDDDAGDHPKIAMVSDEAGWLWFRAILWSRKHKTNGFVPAGAIRGLTKARRPDALTKELVTAIPPGFKVGLFEVHDRGFVVHDFDDFGPPSRESEPEPTKADRSAAGRKAAAARWASKKAETPSDGACDSHAIASQSHPESHAIASGIAPIADAKSHPEPHASDAIPSRARADAPASAPASPDPDPVLGGVGEEARAHEDQPHEPEKPKTVRDEIAELLTGSPEIVEAIEAGTVKLDRMVGRLLGDAGTGGWKDRRVVECLPFALRALSMASDPRQGPQAYVCNVVARVARPGVLEREMQKFTREPKPQRDRDDFIPPVPEWDS